MIKSWSIFFILLFAWGPVMAGPMKSSAGIELGGNGTALFSDRSVQAFGAGAGYQGSVFFNHWNDHPVGLKARYEIVSLQEVALQKSASDYILTGTNLKSLTQGWNLISVGAEGRFNMQSQLFFWEALLGYAMGQASNVSVTYSLPDVNVVSTSQQTTSGFVVSGGFGIRRVFTDHITGLMSLRTFFLLAPIYNSSALSSKTFIPFPLLFNIGVETPF